MSVLVATPGRLTTDSQDSGETLWFGPKAWRMHGYLIGVAGSCKRGDQALERGREHWPEHPTTRRLRAAVAAWPSGAGDDTTWVVVTADSVWSIEGGYVFPRTFPFVAGCGAPWAGGRLSSDPDPVAAVAVACKNDIYCGGRIRDLRVRKP